MSDFGFKCYMDVENKAQSKTAGVSILKLVEPELLNESKHYTNKVDVYSFDVVVKLPKISVIEQGNGKKATIPKKNVNKISHNLISKWWSTDPDDSIKSCNFKLFDGAEKQLSDIKSFFLL